MESQELMNEIMKRVSEKLAAKGELTENVVEIDGQVLTALKAQNAVDKRCTAIQIPAKMIITADAKAVLSRNEVKVIRK